MGRRPAESTWVVRRHRRAAGAAVRRAVDDEVPGAVEEEAGPAPVSVLILTRKPESR